MHLAETHRRVGTGEGVSVAAFEKKARGRSVWVVSPYSSWPGWLREPPLAEQDEARQQEHTPRHAPHQLPARQHLLH